MVTGTRVVTKSGETITVESDTYEFENGVLYCYDDTDLVMLSIPQENVAFVVGCEMADSPDDSPDEAPPEPAKESAYTPADCTPDPGPGYRLIDKAVDKPQEGDEYWSVWHSEWEPRVSCTSKWSSEDVYRRRVTPEPVCKREAFSGGGSPSPRECGVCGEGPCDDWVILDPVLYADHIPRVGIDWFENLAGQWVKQEHFHSNQSIGGWHNITGCQTRCRRSQLPVADLPKLPVESPDDWVTQDRVGARPGIDERQFTVINGKPQGWDEVKSSWSAGMMHGDVKCGETIEVRCRRKDLPPLPAESPDDWVTQDRVPARNGVDRGFFSPVIEKTMPLGTWLFEEGVIASGCRHGDKMSFGGLLNVWCRRKDLPPLPTEIHIGDSVVITESPKREDSWDGCRRTVQAKVKNGYVIGKVGEPISRIYLDRELRVIPKSDGE